MVKMAAQYWMMMGSSTGLLEDRGIGISKALATEMDPAANLTSLGA
jgi:hypothetical protein